METETIWILDIPSTCVALDSEEAQLVQKRNEEYQEVCPYVHVHVHCIMSGCHQRIFYSAWQVSCLGELYRPQAAGDVTV